MGLSSTLSSGSNYQLVVNGVRDVSPAGNAARQAACPVTLVQPAYSLPGTTVCDGQNSRSIPVEGLPVGAHDPWTINYFVRTDKAPANRTLIAGFGQAADSTGHGRYLSKFANGIHFWSGDRDCDTTSPRCASTKTRPKSALPRSSWSRTHRSSILHPSIRGISNGVSKARSISSRSGRKRCLRVPWPCCSRMLRRTPIRPSR